MAGIDLRKEKDPARLRQIAQLLEQENEILHRQLERLAQENAKLKGLHDEGRGELAALIEELAQARAAAGAPGKNASERRSRLRRPSTPRDKKKPRSEFGPTSQPGLEHTEQRVELSADEQKCDCCGQPLKPMGGGFEESEHVELVERVFRVVKLRRQKYKKTCECEHPVVTAAKPAALTVGGRYGTTLIVAIAVAKFLNHQPLHRQEADFARLGLTMSRQSMFTGLWLLCHHLSASYEALQAEALRDDVVHIDETHWKALDAKGQTRQLWGMTSQLATYYRVLDNRSSGGARAMLGEYGGWVMCDGLAVYLKAAREGGYLLVGCWTHGRRYLVKCEADFPEVTPVLDWIDELFRLERQCDDEHGDDGAARLAMRHSHSAPLVAKIKAWLDSDPGPPGTSLERAVNYLRGQWSKLTVFLEHAEVPLSNNAAERALRGGVIGRKNFSGTRSRRGEIVAATLYSLITSARQVGVDPAKYLVAVVRRDLEQPGAVLLPREYRDSLAPSTSAT